MRQKEETEALGTAERTKPAGHHLFPVLNSIDIMARNWNVIKSKYYKLLILVVWSILSGIFSPVCAQSVITNNCGDEQHGDKQSDLTAESRRKLTYYYLAAQHQKSLDNFAAMHDLLRHCIEISPNDPAANFDLALTHFTLGEDSLGLMRIKTAVKNDPHNPWYLEILASTYIELYHKPDEAIPILEELSKQQSKRTDILGQLFQLYKINGRTQDAINALDRIQLLQGNSTRIASQKYALYLDLGDTIQAFNQLKSLCDEFPYDATCLLLLGDQYMSVNKTDSALAAYAKVEHIDPQNIMLQTSRLQYHLLTGDTIRFRQMRDSVAINENADLSLRINALGSVAREGLQDSTFRTHAEEIFGKVLSNEKPPVQFLQLYLTYKAYTGNADEETLISIMERILQVDPSNMETLTEMLQFYVEKDDFIRVGELCQNALIYHPGELEFHYFLGLSLAQQEKKHEAIEALTTAVRQSDEESRPDMMGDIYALLGDIHHKLGNVKESFAAYDSCLVYSPDNAMCLNNYAYYLSLKNEQLDKAEKMSYQAIKAAPGNKTYLDTYAWALFMQADYTTARIYMDRVVDPAQTDSTLIADEEISSVLLEHAGDIYAQCEQTEQAIRLWKLALLKSEDKKNALLKRKIKKRKYIRK